MYIDLFAGCGGLSLGLHHAGWRGLFAIEKNEDAYKTLSYNLITKRNHFDWPSWLPKKNLEIDSILKQYKNELIQLRGKVDLVAGGPPCQGFSSAGLRKEDDVRNGLIRSYLKFILYVQPKVIFFENVKGFTLKFKKNKSKGIAYSEYVLDMLARFGYKVEGKMIDFSKFGVPQKRTRFILIAIRNDIARKKNVEPKKVFQLLTQNKEAFLRSKDLPQNPNLANAISDLLKVNGLEKTPDRKNFFSGLYSKTRSKYQKVLRAESNSRTVPDSHSFPKHRPEVEKRFKMYLKQKRCNKNLTVKFKKKHSISKHTIIPMSGHLPTPTITSLPDDLIHYSEPRILTVREYARIQSFPDWFEFKGKYTTGGPKRVKEVPRYTQIGNAIPPLFGEQSGIALQQLLR
jgi:DNA (cytosine-5)-methyltransferase 1